MQRPANERPAIEVVAHRGGPFDGPADVPEHSLAAYLRAVDSGADALECDVRLTADGQLVCVHDARIDRTSNGRGRVSKLTLEQLQEVNFAGEVPGAEPTSILTLDALLEGAMSRSSTVRFAIETKHPTRYAGRVERAVVEAIRRHGLDGERVRVMSFSAAAMERFARVSPELPRVFLTEYLMAWLRSGWRPANASAVGLSTKLIRRHPQYVEKLIDKGVPVHAWTVDEPDDVRYCVDHGISAIITNKPVLVREVLNDAGVS